jgi:hypothetical protein
MKQSSGDFSREAAKACLQARRRGKSGTVASHSVIASAATCPPKPWRRRKQSRIPPRRCSGLLRRICAKLLRNFVAELLAMTALGERALRLGLVPRTQRSASSAVRCRAGAHASACGAASWVPALRCASLRLSGTRESDAGGSSVAEPSLHFVSNCNPRVQEVLIDCDLGMSARLERRSRAQRLIGSVHRDQRNVIASPLSKAPKWCFSAFHEPVAPKRAVRAALQACP